MEVKISPKQIKYSALLDYKRKMDKNNETSALYLSHCQRLRKMRPSTGQKNFRLSSSYFVILLDRSVN